jgi:hypothetical protein
MHTYKLIQLKLAKFKWTLCTECFHETIIALDNWNTINPRNSGRWL